MNPLQYLYVFLIGGAICLIGQILVIRTNLTPSRILLCFLLAGTFLQGIGVYETIFNFAGAGISVPIIGFGALLSRGAIEAVHADGIMGAFTGGIAATAGGLTAAIFFGFIMALLFRSRTKKQ